ncbi:universal stress protein [Cryptosporangium aurantiacum]|uniref:Nucleotide-binding universal stress protein, UspA family n=1 Tax=Cryptosporangium aurantiacum TaxID=134849 RepID=A0A1M7TZ12_9ACTN|nr:universal stress protein [Cryptosporangium aurantiacum]SHN75959.1 Nucleotide-binding universal stress protein, UspA family [Cryptosporangium aurantiacum]
MANGVIVGVDGSPGGVRAMDWAAREAAARRVPLHVVVAETTSDGELGPRVLEQATARAAGREPELTVTGAVWPDPPAAALLGGAAEADLLVVGRSGRGSRVGMHLGSVPVSVIRHAPCPVTVVAGSPTGAPPRWDGDVLVGIDGSAHDPDVLAAAFAAATCRDGRVTVVHAPAPGDDDAGRGLIDAALADWTPRFPDVEATGRVVREGPIRALGALSQGAALLVLGAVGRAGFPSMLLGSVPRALAGQAACPVLVVRN